MFDYRSILLPTISILEWREIHGTSTTQDVLRCLRGLRIATKLNSQGSSARYKTWQQAHGSGTCYNVYFNISIDRYCVSTYILLRWTSCDNILVLLEACPAYESLQSQTHNHPANQKTTKSKNIKRKLPLGKSNMTDDTISTCGNSSEIHHVSEEGA